MAESDADERRATVPRPDAARTMLAKLRDFTARLDDDERAHLAALLAPGVALAYGDDEVEGYGRAGWAPTDLPGSLAAAVRERHLRIVDEGP